LLLFLPRPDTITAVSDEVVSPNTQPKTGSVGPDSLATPGRRALVSGHLGYDYLRRPWSKVFHIVQELCESRGGRPGLSALMSLTVSVDVKQH